jgi:integrase
MNITIESNFQFSVSSMSYLSNGELHIALTANQNSEVSQFVYTANLGSGEASARSMVSLLQYAREYVKNSSVKESTKSSYRLMISHLGFYGDTPLEKIETSYLQGFISYMQSNGLKPGSVRLYFQKLVCVLNEAYKNELFDIRILKRVKRPKREQGKRGFLTETDLKKLAKHRLSDKYNNIQTMFLFSCMTGLRFGDIQGLRWKDVKRSGKHLVLEFHQQKTDTDERVPLCAEAGAILQGLKRNGEYVFGREANPTVNVILKKWCKLAKVKKNVSFHMARHTFCVLLLTKDVPIYTVQQLMCHSDIGSTNVYADLLNKTKAKALRKLPEIMI